MSIKLIAILLVIALLWWIYDFCGGDFELSTDGLRDTLTTSLDLFS